MHGTLTALYNSAAQARTVNTLALEQYVADTVPGGVAVDAGAGLGGAGPQGRTGASSELEAQAVAVRSYVAGRPGRLRRLRGHVRPDLPDLPRHRVRDGRRPWRRPTTRQAR